VKEPILGCGRPPCRGPKWFKGFVCTERMFLTHVTGQRKLRPSPMSAYYNEHDPFAAAWLRELIKAGHIAPGEVDERSIEDILPSDLREFTQCHFFAGIGVWSYALRRAGWPDDIQVWTGSCPCQPFSAAGKRGGTADERHLWPAFYHLIQSCSPDVVFGEQVASKDGLAWFDSVSTDLEAASYAVGAADLCSAGFGAPHIRQRLYFVANSEYSQRGTECEALSETHGWNGLGRGGNAGSVEHPASEQVGLSGRARLGREADGGLANNNNKGLEGRLGMPERSPEQSSGPRGLVNGFWRDAEWIPCRDGKYRPIEPGVTPLATGVTNRVGKLRGYGNALTAEVARGFIESYLEVEQGVK